MDGCSGEQVFRVSVPLVQDLEMGTTLVLGSLEGLIGDWLHSLPC